MSSWHNVEVEMDGNRYVGKYRVEGGIITVLYEGDGGGDKETKVGNSEPETLARLLLSEIVAEKRKQGRP